MTTPPSVSGGGAAWALEGALEPTLADLLEELGDERRAPGSGSAAAAAIAMAAAVVAMVARASREAWALGAGAAGQAEALKARATSLLDEDASAYREAAAALASATRDEGGAAADPALGSKLERAAAVPLALAQTAGDTALLAAEVAEHGADAQCADAVAACLITEGAGRAAAHLVEINLGLAPDDVRRMLVRDIKATLAEARKRALAAGT